jgi:hypothetical protein
MPPKEQQEQEAGPVNSFLLPNPLPDRRDFLKATTGVLAGIVVAGTPLAAIAKCRAWAIDLMAFTNEEGAGLLAVTRTICPHDKLDNLAYALVVQAIDADAHHDEHIRTTLKDGLAQLGPNFATAAEAPRVAALKEIESSPFFQFLRLKTVQTLYASPVAYAYFGYQGEAFSKGGYLFRGFNDLRWLPEVPPEDSGPMPVEA